MFSFFKKKERPLLTVRVNGEHLCDVLLGEPPCEKTPKVQVAAGGTIEFIAADGTTHCHSLGAHSGWLQLSIRVHPNLACQADCIIGDSDTYGPDDIFSGRATGIRFQPFFLPGGAVRNEELFGTGLFARGLHFSGMVTPSNIILSCTCDHCKKSFQIQSFHAGFSRLGYFYSGSGTYTLTVPDMIPGAPAALSTPEPAALAALEGRLPTAPDGTSYRYAHPFRCPHCAAPYIDFSRNRGERANEYYGNYLVGAQLERFDDGPA